MREINKIILHCSATKEGQYYDKTHIKQWHLQRGFTDIGYHYIILLDGSIQDARDIRTIGAHCKGQNAKSIGICYIGGLDSNGNGKDTRTEEQRQSLFNLIDDLLIAYDLTIDDVYCHYQFAKKLCPCFKIEEFKDDFIQWKKQ